MVRRWWSRWIGIELWDAFESNPGPNLAVHQNLLAGGFQIQVFAPRTHYKIRMCGPFKKQEETTIKDTKM